MINSIIFSGHIAGKTTAFCKAMGWSVKPYQTLFMIRHGFMSDYRKFIPKESVDFYKWWYKHLGRKDRGHEWQAVIFDESYDTSKLPEHMTRELKEIRSHLSPSQ